MTTFAITNDLNWKVAHRPLFFTDATGNQQQWNERVAVVREDTNQCLGAVSPDYETVQNSDLLSLINPMVEEGLLDVKNMGHLNNGARVFAQAKVNSKFQVIGEDYDAYITLLNGHVGNASVAIGPTAIRVICGNTFAMAYSGLGERFRHSAGVNQRLLDSTAVMDYVNTAMLKYSQHVTTLALAPCSSQQYSHALTQVFDRDLVKIRQVEALNKLFYNGNGNEGKTYYDAFNAITDFSSNLSRKTTEGRFYYANFAQGNQLNQKAMRVLTELAAV